MKRIWAWLSERLFVSEPLAPVMEKPLAMDTPDAPWSLSQVNELRWA